MPKETQDEIISHDIIMEYLDQLKSKKKIEIDDKIYEFWTKKSANSTEAEFKVKPLFSRLTSVSNGMSNDEETQVKLNKIDESIESLRSHLSALSYEQRDTLHEISKQVSRLSKIIDNLSTETHERLIPSTLDIDPQEYPLHRYIPIAIYLSEYNIEKVQYFILSLKEFLDHFEFKISDEYPPRIGSFWQKLTGKTKEAITSETMKDTLDSAKHALELATIEKAQSEINKNHADAAKNLLDSLKDFDNAAVQVGSILIVKNTNNGIPNVAMKTLSKDEIILLAKNQKLLGKPSQILDELSKHALDDKNT